MLIPFEFEAVHLMHRELAKILETGAKMELDHLKIGKGITCCLSDNEEAFWAKMGGC